MIDADLQFVPPAMLARDLGTTEKELQEIAAAAYKGGLSFAVPKSLPGGVVEEKFYNRAQCRAIRAFLARPEEERAAYWIPMEMCYRDDLRGK